MGLHLCDDGAALVDTANWQAQKKHSGLCFVVCRTGLAGV